MNRKRTLSLALVAVGIALLVTPALVPAQQLRYHETGAGTTADRAQLQEEGYQVVAYENLSTRAQDLYVRALRDGGEYAVPVGEGAPDFNYTTRTDVRGIVIERPPDGDLPPADEPTHMAEYARDDGERGNESASAVRQRRQQIQRYDLVSLRTDSPPLTATPNLARLLSAVLGVVCIGVGGYASSRP